MRLHRDQVNKVAFRMYLSVEQFSNYNHMYRAKEVSMHIYYSNSEAELHIKFTSLIL